jgi:hypothetical protein
MQRMNDGSPTARKASPSMEGPCADYAVEEARKALVSGGAHVMPAAITRSCLGVEEDAWERFLRDRRSPPPACRLPRDRCAATQNHARRDARSRMQAAGRHAPRRKCRRRGIGLDIPLTLLAPRRRGDRIVSWFVAIVLTAGFGTSRVRCGDFVGYCEKRTSTSNWSSNRDFMKRPSKAGR